MLLHVSAGNAEQNSLQLLLTASVAKLKGSQERAACNYDDATTQYEHASASLVSSLHANQDLGLCWLMQDKLCAVLLDQAEVKSIMVSCAGACAWLSQNA